MQQLFSRIPDRFFSILASANKELYEYDQKRQVLIKLSPNSSPRIIKKGESCWRPLGPGDDRYARAVYQGQGCWEDLITITGEEGEKILEEWGEPAGERRPYEEC